MGAIIADVRRGSLAYKYGVRAGNELVSVNGRVLRDILDYEMSVADVVVELEIMAGEKSKIIAIDNPQLENLGIHFSTSLFDGIKSCANKCVFCFIDQLPSGMRDSVYVKDDDYRLSFLYGNFITLTNMRDSDIDRIIADRLSPLYISMHATNPDLRMLMLGRKKKDKSFEYLRMLSEAGIEMHIQMVLCPGLNDGDELDRSIDHLSGEYESVASVGIVPVGLTGHREGLYELRSFEKNEAVNLIRQVERWQGVFEKEKGCAWVYIADEFYVSTGHSVPPAVHYEEFPQIENGIGLSRMFIDEAREKMKDLGKTTRKRSMAVVTGRLFASILEKIATDIKDSTGINFDVVPIENRYFGGKVNVTGLLTGCDILEVARTWFNKQGKPDVIVLPGVIFNGDGLTLDGHAKESISEQLGVEVEVVESSGSGLIEYLMKG